MIRPFCSEDTDVVMDIWLTASLRAHDFIPASYWREQFSIVWYQYLPITETYVFAKPDRVARFISILNGDTIGALFVVPDCQRQGIGSALIRHVKEIFPDLTLCVYGENTAAGMFYEKQGFGIVSRRPTETGHDEYVMRVRAQP